MMKYMQNIVPKFKVVEIHPFPIYMELISWK